MAGGPAVCEVTGNAEGQDSCYISQMKMNQKKKKQNGFFSPLMGKMASFWMQKMVCVGGMFSLIAKSQWPNGQGVHFVFNVV